MAAEEAATDEKRPFHESIIGTIKNVNVLSELALVETLLVATKIPKGHDEIIAALTEKAMDVRADGPDDAVLASILEQKRIAAEPKKAISCKIERHEVELDPPINVLHVELSKGDGCWPETLSDESHLKAFLRGVSAGASLSGGMMFFPPELPSSTTATFVLREISKEGVDEYDPSDGGGLFSATRHEEGGGFFSRG